MFRFRFRFYGSRRIYIEVGVLTELVVAVQGKVCFVPDEDALFCVSGAAT